MASCNVLLVEGMLASGGMLLAVWSPSQGGSAADGPWPADVDVDGDAWDGDAESAGCGGGVFLGGMGCSASCSTLDAGCAWAGCAWASSPLLCCCADVVADVVGITAAASG